MGYDSMIPAYASRVVRTGVEGYSVLLASSGAGATVGALTVASLGRLDRKERLVLAGLFVFAVALLASAVLPEWVGQRTPHPARLLTASLCLFGVGFGAVLFYSVAQTIIQNVLPDQLRGRVMAIWLIGYSGSVPLGALWTGRLAKSQGVTFAMAVSALLCVALGLGGAVAWLAPRSAPLPPPRPSSPDESAG